MRDAIIGAVVGALAIVVFEVIRHRLGDRARRRTLLRLLREEVRHLVEYLDARIDVGRRMIAASENGQMLPGTGSPPPSVIYRTYLPEVAADLTADHRLRLNVVYGSAESMHATMNGAEERFLRLTGFRDHTIANEIVRDGVRDVVDHMGAIKAVAQQFIEDSKEPFHLIGPRPKSAEAD